MKRKRTLITFSEKPTCPNLLTLSNILLPIFRSEVQERVPTKKKGKRTLVTFSKKHTHPLKSNFTYHLPLPMFYFCFYFSILKRIHKVRAAFTKNKKIKKIKLKKK